MAATLNIKKGVRYFMGTCLPTFKINAARIKVPYFEYNDYLNMHFKTSDIIFAHDPNQLCNVGDMVLVQTLQKPMTKLITHKVIKIIFPLGDITDPITGKKVAGSVYRSDVKEINKLFEESENAFDYERAPPKGYLFDKRDFTHKPAMKKLYEDPNDPQPYSI